MGKVIKTSKMPLEEIRKLLEAGFKLELVSQQCGYPISVLSNFCRAWGIKRKNGRPRKAE